ncbi:hypothetical protein PENTCL1PPCAC_1122 [Pristionchus entomophagus]|uniref:Uncharacterized protein n=1 Tax=Pristionchus entomophagus TaxID=358040 RepID=A0AAV5S9J9_9BILA|nr:hypothetical protein PENTCL1PPCAC_1122 [Pristionchus entomophagus]
MNTTIVPPPTYVFGYFSITGFSILIALIIGVLTATIVACYFDLKSRQPGLNKLPEGAEWVHIPKKRLEAFRSSLRESSKEDELPLLTPNEPSVRSGRTPAVAKPASSTRNQEEKHKRMIEAVYIASGRAVPAQFISASTRTAVPRSARPPGAPPAKPTVPRASGSLSVEKTQSLSDRSSVRTMATLKDGSEISEASTQSSPPVDKSNRKVPESTPEQIERASLAFIREIEKTAPSTPSQPASDPNK